MNLLPHIDIKEPARIQALLEDPRTYSWRAIDSEKLDTFTPDLGLSAYPVPSIVRSSAVAQAGIVSRLRHRFWQTIEQQADHTGPRYIGIVIYLAVGEAHPLELKLGDRDIGRIEPRRQDNRSHLIVADHVVEFIGEMEVLQMSAVGSGRYRIESFALLHERPQPSRYVPSIERLQHRLRKTETGGYDVELHFTTDLAAAAEARLMGAAGEEISMTSGRAGRLHQLTFAGLPPDQQLTARISARDQSGEMATATLQFATRSPQPQPKREVVVPLEIFSPAAADLTGLPLGFGLPLARGAAPELDDCHLRAGDETLPARARIQSRWEDGSAQWALIETRLPQTVSAAALHINSELPIEAAADGLGITLRDLRLADWRFCATLADGTRLRASALKPIRRDEHKATYVIEHQDARGVAQLRSKLWLQFYSGQRFIRLRHRLEVLAPEHAEASDESDALLSLREFSLRIPFAGQRVDHAGRQSSLADEWQLRHDHDQWHEICREARAGRAAGHIRVHGDAGSLGIGLRHFWQSYPKALTVDAQGIDICLLPERAGRELPGDEDAAHRLYFWLDAAGYRLKAGLALTSDILLDFGAEARAFDWLEAPPLARPAIDYLNSTGVLPPIGARQDSLLPSYEALTDRALQSFVDDREAHRAYGQLNFGDWYGESGWSWGNNEYDSIYCGYSEFLRGGDVGWAAWAAAAARHLADVDTVNFSAVAANIGGQAMHIPGHLGGYLPPFFRSKMRGTNLIPSHTWVEGPLLHWLLTGDAAVAESLQKTRGWLLQARFFEAYDFSNAREAGWHLIHLCALAWLDDPAALNAASILVERVLERQSPGGGWERILTDSHCGCGYPRCRGEAGFMVGVLLSGLMRYYRHTGDPAVAEAILGGARWLIANTFDHESGYFRYTSCANRTLGGKFQCTQWVLEGLAAAWSISGDVEVGGYLQRGLGVIGRFPVGIDHSGMGKAMAQQMRYVPSILATLSESPLELDPT